jgi:PAS domain S-box-containing protein
MPALGTTAAALPLPQLAGKRRWVFGAGAVLVGLVTLTLSGMAWHEHRQLQDIVTERNELLARVLTEQTTRNIEAAALAVATLADLLQRGQPPESAQTSAAMQQSLVNLPFLRSIAVLDNAGHVRASAQPSEVGRLIDLAALGPLPQPGVDRLAEQAPGRSLSDLARGQATAIPSGVSFLPLLRTVRRANGETLLVVALLNPTAFVNFQQLLLDGPGAAAALATYDGRLIAGTDTVMRPAGASLKELPPFSRFLPAREHGTWVGEGLREGTQLAAFRVSATRPLAVLVEVERAAVLKPWWVLVRNLSLAGAAIFTMVVSFTFVAWRSVRAREIARAERDAAQAQALRRERELSVTIQSLQELIFRTDAQGLVTYANQSWAMSAGAGKPLWDLVASEQRNAARALFARASDTDVRHLQAVIAEQGGRRRSFDISVMPLHEEGRLTGFAGSAVDVTSRIVAQRRLQMQLAFTEQLMNVSPFPMSLFDLKRRYVMVNQAWEDFTGRTRAETVGQIVGSALPQSERAQHEAEDRALIADGQPRRYEAQVRHRDGTVRDLMVNKLLVPGDEEQPACVLAVMVDVTEFRNAERSTREARDVAEEASRAKSEFIANISHELRTPLQSIIGFSELGLRRGKDQPRLSSMFDDIHNAGQRMLALVNDLLDVAKIESTVGTIHLERTDLRGLVGHVLKELAPLLEGKQLQVLLQLGTQPLRGKVDPLRFQQVLRNVVANAIKFSPPGSRILVQGGHTDMGELELRVADEGPGIPPAELEDIFQAFVQSSKTKDGSGGTGLGLAISRKIVEAHGGTISAQNRPEGGAVFIIVLPNRGSTETQPVPL